MQHDVRVKRDPGADWKLSEKLQCSSQYSDGSHKQNLHSPSVFFQIYFPQSCWMIEPFACKHGQSSNKAKWNSFYTSPECTLRHYLYCVIPVILTVNLISTATADCLPELQIRASRFELMGYVMWHFSEAIPVILNHWLNTWALSLFLASGIPSKLVLFEC